MENPEPVEPPQELMAALHTSLHDTVHAVLLIAGFGEMEVRVVVTDPASGGMLTVGCRSIDDTIADLQRFKKALEEHDKAVADAALAAIHKAKCGSHGPH